MTCKTAQKNETQKLTLTASESLLAGAIAGFTARCVTAPLDLVKIRYQLDSPSANALYRYGYSGIWRTFRDVARKEGFHALWKGNVPGLCMVVPFSATQFAMYNMIRPRVGILDPAIASFVSGAAAGLVATMVTFPLDVMRTNLAASRTATRTLSLRLSPRALFRGFIPAALAIAPTTALSFALFSLFSDALAVALAETPVVGLTAGVAGGMAGTLAKLVMLPMDTMKKNMQVSTTEITMRRVGDRLWNEAGVRGFWRGAVPSLLKAAPNSALHFGVFEATKQVMLRKKRKAEAGVEGR